jgi:hypothetical protein
LRVTQRIFKRGENRLNGVDALTESLQLPLLGVEAIRLPPNMPDDAVERFEGELLTLCEAHGVDIVYPRTRILAEQREQNRRFRKCNEHLIREARKIVREMKTRQLKGRPRHVSSDLWRRNRWPYAPEEIRIDEANEDRIREVLEFIGRGDEFERIRQEAMQELF